MACLSPGLRAAPLASLLAARVAIAGEARLVARRASRGRIRTVSTAAILIAVLILLVLGDIAVVRAWTRRKRNDPGD